MPKHFQLSQAVAFFQTIQLLRLSSLLKHDNLRSSRKEIVCKELLGRLKGSAALFFVSQVCLTSNIVIQPT